MTRGTHQPRVDGRDEIVIGLKRRNPDWPLGRIGREAGVTTRTVKRILDRYAAQMEGATLRHPAIAGSTSQSPGKTSDEPFIRPPTRAQLMGKR